MKTTCSRVLPFLALLALASCQCPSSMVDAGKLAPLNEDIYKRHDAYVQADPSLTDLQRRVYLRSTEIARDVLKTALTPASQPTR